MLSTPSTTSATTNPCGSLPGDREQEQPRRQRADHAGHQRVARRQELGGDQVRGAPDDRRGRGQSGQSQHAIAAGARNGRGT